MKSFLIAFFTLFVSFSFAQKFEGTISIVKKTLSDTIYYSYSIKKNHVRVDEYDKYQRLQKSYIINLQDSSIFAVNHSQKVYSKINVPPQIPSAKNNLEVINTGIFKYINGYKCYQWRVRDASKNTEVAYWLADEGFDFYSPMASIWTSTEDVYMYYMSLPVTTTVMPLLTECRTLLRDQKSSYAVIEIEKSSINDEIFTIPSTFTVFQLSR